MKAPGAIEVQTHGLKSVGLPMIKIKLFDLYDMNPIPAPEMMIFILKCNPAWLFLSTRPKPFKQKIRLVVILWCFPCAKGVQLILTLLFVLPNWLFLQTVTCKVIKAFMTSQPLAPGNHQGPFPDWEPGFQSWSCEGQGVRKTLYQWCYISQFHKSNLYQQHTIDLPHAWLWIVYMTAL